MPTDYERRQGQLDRDRVSREIKISGAVIARGVSAPLKVHLLHVLLKRFD